MIRLSYPISAILPAEGSVARDGYQECKLRKTSGRRPRWFCRYLVDAISGPGKTKRIERRKYFGLCSEVGKREAERERDEFKRSVNVQREQGVRESQIRMSNWIATYRAVFIPTLKPNSRGVYDSTLAAIEKQFGKQRLCDVSRDGIQQWLNDLSKTRAKATLRRVLAVFSSLFEEAIASDSFEARNPCDRVKIPHGVDSTVDRRALTPDEIRRLLAVCDGELSTVVRIAVFCGLRIGEILALQHEDVRNGAIHVSRNQSQYSAEVTVPKSLAGVRVVPLGPVEIPPGAGRIVSLDYRSSYEQLREAFRAAAITIEGTAWHALRRTFATYFDAAGATQIEEQMGHGSRSMSERYIRRGFADRAAAVDRMAGFLLGESTGKPQ